MAGNSLLTTHRLLAHLGSEKRLRILDELSSGEKRFYEIKRDLNLTSSELVRQLGRLAGANLIEKRGSGRYAISAFGAAVRSATANLEFLAAHSDYFQTHDTSHIPSFMLLQLTPEMRVEAVARKFGPLDLVMEHGKSIRDFYWIVSDSIPRFALPQVRAKINNGVKFRAIYPRSYLRQVRPFLGRDIIQNVEFRVVDEVKVIVCVTDQFAYVCLPRFKDQTIDREVFMFSSSALYRSWCGQLFDFYWSRARSS